MRLVRKITTLLFGITLAVWVLTGVMSAKKLNKDAPVITADSDQLQLSVNDGEEKLLAGLSAKDKKDGDLTKDIMVGGRSKFSAPGVLDVTYIVFDNNNNSGKYTRKITYTDYHSPEFSLDSALVFGAGENISIMKSLKLNDVIDGDISDKIKIVSSNVDSAQEGVYTVGIEATSAYGDVASIKLPICIVKRKAAAPRISLSDYVVYIDKNSSFDARSYVKGVTLADGTAVDKGNAMAAGHVDTATPGCYNVIYSYKDSNGNTGYAGLTVVVRA